MENIDDLMRQKFDSDDPGERFEFQEEYWEQAQLLLEKEESRRRRGLWLFFLLALAFALLAWFLWQNTDLLSHNRVGNATSSVETGAQQADSKLVPENKNEPGVKNAAPTETSNLSTNAKNNSTENVKSGALAELNQSKNAFNKRRRIESNNSVLKAKGRETANQSRNGQSTEKDLGDITGVPALEQEKSLQALLDSGLNTKPSTQASGVKSEQNALSGTDVSGTDQAESAKFDSARAAIELIPFLKQSLFNLPTPLVPFPIPERSLNRSKIPVPASEPIAKLPEPVKDKRLSLGLSLLGSANQTDSNSRWAGWAIGAYGDYRLNQKWSVSVGAQWRFLPGYGAYTPIPDSPNPDQIDQLRYSFGYTRESWKYKTIGLHYLEIPISARWQKGKLGLEGGGAVGTLLAVQDQRTHTKESSLEPIQTTVERRVKGNSSFYKPAYLTAFAGASYRLSPRISILARGHYRFTPVFKTIVEGGSKQGLGYIDLGLKLRLY